ncbi:unnamed protein product [Thlaspi arvense]|uniref:Digalactosyldiacylglycerol synthase 2, chloroplastic n=1 Tax=Thlaspi arvense TaxID=13288 RepID=A0AAU9RA26_THLAR|nr:unnamed protein product [Thlaspi arvense]
MHFATDKRSILPVGDISDTIPDEEADITVLEEPEHRTWTCANDAAATQEYPKSIVCNVHGVNPKFLGIGLRKQEHEEQPFTKRSKGYKELLKLLTRYQKELAGLQVDLYGSAEDSEEIKKAVEKLDLKVDVYPGRDHADSPFHNYIVFLNPSTTDVVCTTTAEALAIGKTIVCANHTSNDFFKQFPNCRVYDDDKGFVRATLKAFGEQPSQLTEQQRHELSWDAATERFIKASDLNRLSRADSNLSKTSVFASSSMSVGKQLEDMSAYIYFLASGFEVSRRAFGAIPGSLQPDEEL